MAISIMHLKTKCKRPLNELLFGLFGYLDYHSYLKNEFLFFTFPFPGLFFLDGYDVNTAHYYIAVIEGEDLFGNRAHVQEFYFVNSGRGLVNGGSYVRCG